jgi:hypothetical protein
MPFGPGISARVRVVLAEDGLQQDGKVTWWVGDRSYQYPYPFFA